MNVFLRILLVWLIGLLWRRRKVEVKTKLEASGGYVICPKCGLENWEGYDKCQKCGTQLVKER